MLLFFAVIVALHAVENIVWRSEGLPLSRQETFEDYVPDARWVICSPRTISLIPLGHMFSKDYVPDPVGAYVLQGRCPQSMTGHLSSVNYVHFSTDSCTFSVAIMACSVVQLTRRVIRNIKEKTKYDHIFCFVCLD